jgi:hypothetical protein
VAWEQAQDEAARLDDERRWYGSTGWPPRWPRWSAVSNCRYPSTTTPIPAVLCAAGADPLAAGLGTLFHAVATVGADDPALLADVRREFPTLTGR